MGEAIADAGKTLTQSDNFLPSLHPTCIGQTQQSWLLPIQLNGFMFGVPAIAPGVSLFGGADSGGPSSGSGGGEGKMARFFQRFMDLLPARHGNDPTHGVLTDAAGNRTLDTFVSGKRSPDTDLTSPYSQAITVQDHAEGHAAARIRELARNEGLSGATLYLNNKPCSGVMGCDALLPHILPRDFRLTVYYPGAQGLPTGTVYLGTGLGIR
jgi:hypothetical protein